MDAEYIHVGLVFKERIAYLIQFSITTAATRNSSVCFLLSRRLYSAWIITTKATCPGAPRFRIDHTAPDVHTDTPQIPHPSRFLPMRCITG
jgi:hypothetical protein